MRAEKHLMIMSNGRAWFLAAVVLAFVLSISAMSPRAAAEETTPSLDVRYYNLSYSSQLYLMYAVSYENVDPDTTPVQMLFWSDGRSDGYELGTETSSVRSTAKMRIDGRDYLVFYSAGISPRELTDTLYCRACVTVGGETYYSNAIKYSPMVYITNILQSSGTSAADKEIVGALRAYGAAAQTRFGYHTERLASLPQYRLTLQNAVLPDGFSTALAAEGNTVTVTAPDVAGKTFKQWVDETGSVVGLTQTLTWSANKDTEIKAVYTDLPTSALGEGMQFAASNGCLVPYFFRQEPITVEATIELPANYGSRGGVLLGNYGCGQQTVNVEIYSGGRVRLFFAQDENNWSVVFNTDVRGGVHHIAVTIPEEGQFCKLYVDGVFAESAEMPCTIPEVRDTMRLGGDYRTGNAQYFKGTLYSLAVWRGVRSDLQIASDALYGTDPESGTLAVCYLPGGTDGLKDQSRNGKDIVVSRAGLSPQSIADRYSLTKTFDTVPQTYEALIETAADVSNRKGCTIIGNYNDTYVPGVSFRVYLNGKPSLCLRYDGEHQDQFTFPNSVLGEGRVHVAITIDDTYVYGYLNGRQVLKKAHCGYMPDLTEYPFSVGGDNRTDNTWWFRDGAIYSVRLYSGYRTAEQIRDDMNYLDTSDPTLMLAYDFEKSFTDLSGNQNALNPYFYEKDFLSSDTYDYTFACVGDTQSVVKYYPEQLHCIYDFILDHVDDMKIARVIGLGDITEDNIAEQWDLTSEQIFRLDGVVPYTVVRGNHDLMARTEEAEPTRTLMFGYYFDNDVYRRQFEGSYNGGVENVYTRFTVCGVPYLMLSLDYGPDDDVLAWANSVCEQFPNDNVIISTHAFLFHDGTTLDANDICPPSHGVGVNDCDVMWNEFVSKHENIVLVLCGHDPSCDIVVSKMTGDHGNTVTCCLINPQDTDRYEQAAGLVALLHFSDGGRTITIENYSTIEEKFYKTNNEITITDVAVITP